MCRQRWDYSYKCIFLISKRQHPPHLTQFTCCVPFTVLNAFPPLKQKSFVSFIKAALLSITHQTGNINFLAVSIHRFCVHTPTENINTAITPSLMHFTCGGGTQNTPQNHTGQSNSHKLFFQEEKKNKNKRNHISTAQSKSIHISLKNKIQC